MSHDKVNCNLSGWPGHSPGAPYCDTSLPPQMISKKKSKSAVTNENLRCLGTEAQHLGALKAVFRPALCSYYCMVGRRQCRKGGCAVQEATAAGPTSILGVAVGSRNCHSSKNPRMVCRCWTCHPGPRVECSRSGAAGIRRLHPGLQSSCGCISPELTNGHSLPV